MDVLHRRSCAFFAAALCLPLTAPAFAQAPGQQKFQPVPASAAARTRLQDVLAQPDGTPIALTNGRRTTVGEVKRALARRPVPNLRPVAVSPRRAQLLSSQTTVRDAVNATAAAAQTGGGSHYSATPAAANANPMSERPTGIRAQSTVASLPAGIALVNNRATGIVVTPGANLVILGKGFGQRVQLPGATPGARGGQGNAQIASSEFKALPLQITSWSDNEIDATLPAGVRGIADQAAGVSVQIVTAGGQTFLSQPGKFVAEREEITIASGLDQIVGFASAPSWRTNDFGQATGTVKLTAAGSVSRLENKNDDFDCKRPGQDRLGISLAPGFEVTQLLFAVNGPTDSGGDDGFGNPGDRVFFPGYGATLLDPQHASVSWGVYRRHVSTNVINSVGAIFDTLFGVQAVAVPLLTGIEFALEYSADPIDLTPVAIDDVIESKNTCLSSYSIALKVVGPAGVSPY